MAHLGGLVPRAQSTTASGPQSPHPRPQQHVRNRWTPTTPKGRAPDPVDQHPSPPIQLSEAARPLPEHGRSTGDQGLGSARSLPAPGNVGCRADVSPMVRSSTRGVPQTSPQGGHRAHTHAPGQKTSHMMSHGPQGPVFIEIQPGAGTMDPSPAISKGRQVARQRHRRDHQMEEGATPPRRWAAADRKGQL